MRVQREDANAAAYADGDIRPAAGTIRASGWWPAKSAFEVMVGAVLVQSTAWANVERALANLEAADALSPRRIRDMPTDELETLVRPSGFFRVKAKRLKALCSYLGERFGDDLDAMAERPTECLRRELTAVNGVGAETADDILLYALGRPVFVVDAFTRRVFHRLGWSRADSGYDELQALFHDRLPRHAPTYNEYHALIVRHGNASCRRKPACSACPLSSGCPRIGV